MDYLQRVLNGLKVFTDTGSEAQEASQEKEKPEQLLDEVTFEGVAKYIKNGRCECNNNNDNDAKLIYSYCKSSDKCPYMFVFWKSSLYPSPPPPQP